MSQVGDKPLSRRNGASAAHCEASRLSLSFSMDRFASHMGGISARSNFGTIGEMSIGSNSSFSFETTKVLKEVLRKREGVPALRVLPKKHLLDQLVLQEHSERELFTLQERSLRYQILHKRDEDRLKKEEQRLQQNNRERLDELKRRQAEELAAKKEEVTSFQKRLDGEIKEKLKIVCTLQPRMNIAATVIAEIKNETSSCRLLPELLEEEKRLLKALRGDGRQTKNTSDCGAVPYWIRTCVAGSFNVAAILQEAPYRATVEDAIKVPNAALRKVVVVRCVEDDCVVAWVHVRAGNDPVELAVSLAQLPEPEHLSLLMNAGVVWPKEDCIDLIRKSKTVATPEMTNLLAPIIGVSTASLSYEGVTTYEFTKKDIETIGSLACA